MFSSTLRSLTYADESTVNSHLTALFLRLDLARLSPTLLPRWFTSLLNLLQNVEMDLVSRLPSLSTPIHRSTVIDNRFRTVALILAPTRELATQILRECRALSRGGEIKSACAYGGTSSIPCYPIALRQLTSPFEL